MQMALTVRGLLAPALSIHNKRHPLDARANPWPRQPKSPNVPKQSISTSQNFAPTTRTTLVPSQHAFDLCAVIASLPATAANRGHYFCRTRTPTRTGAGLPRARARCGPRMNHHHHKHTTARLPRAQRRDYRYLAPACHPPLSHTAAWPAVQTKHHPWQPR